MMCIKGCSSQEQKKATEEKPDTEVKDTVKSCSSKCKPYEKTITSDNKINIEFDPDKSCHEIKCKKIVNVQFIRYVVDGGVSKFGDYYSGFKFKDKVATQNGWAVDHHSSETTPDYQQGGDYGTIGNKNGGSNKTTMSDPPQTGGGDKGFYDPKTNKSGIRKMVKEFATFAYCMEGDDCGKWYEGITWKCTKTWEDHKNGSEGKSEVTSFCVKQPTKELLEAFNKFNKEKSFTPCK